MQCTWPAWTGDEALMLLVKGVLWVSVDKPGACVTEGGEMDLGCAGGPTDRKGMTRKGCDDLCPPSSLEPGSGFHHRGG